MVDNDRRDKWKQSSDVFTKNVISEELGRQIKKSTSLRQGKMLGLENADVKCVFLTLLKHLAAAKPL